VTESHKEERMIASLKKRIQDFLMPGLRHAHTLQQLRELSNITSLVIFLTSNHKTLAIVYLMISIVSGDVD